MRWLQESTAALQELKSSQEKIRKLQAKLKQQKYQLSALASNDHAIQEGRPTNSHKHLARIDPFHASREDISAAIEDLEMKVEESSLLAELRQKQLDKNAKDIVRGTEKVARLKVRSGACRPALLARFPLPLCRFSSSSAASQSLLDVASGSEPISVCELCPAPSRNPNNYVPARSTSILELMLHAANLADLQSKIRSQALRLVESQVRHAVFPVPQMHRLLVCWADEPLRCPLHFARCWDSRRTSSSCSES